MDISRPLRAALKKIWIDRGEKTHHFIHIPKNGGQSVRRALELNRAVSLGRPFHQRYRDVAATLPDDMRYFCIVRNPWARTASRYMFGRQNAANWSEDDPRRIYILGASFDDFVRDQKVLPIPEHPGQPWMGPLSSWMNQLEWIMDEKGAIACDCLRLEHLESDISAYLNRSIHIRRRNKTRSSYDYREMFTDESAAIIGDLFKDDIDYFGFEFEGAAARNIAV